MEKHGILHAAARRGTMGIAAQMVAAAVECVEKPGRISVWSKSLGKYVCREDPVLCPDLVRLRCRAQLRSSMAAGHRRSRRDACLTAASTAGLDQPRHRAEVQCQHRHNPGTRRRAVYQCRSRTGQ
jgi:hypothetical protein